ncbi:hypothetical protein GCM10011335_45610 [Aureimonas glaciei]|uniref:Uncharacterized protein n=1 Tax=Aureimonas glaciei TaxID=1776957 RepID=A0A917DI72_9HYPH|nr:hypothetical protein GCM10011335_45610 [Aureimonas glaciei]
MPIQNHMFESVMPISVGGAPTMYGANHFTCASAWDVKASPNAPTTQVNPASDAVQRNGLAVRTIEDWAVV